MNNIQAVNFGIHRVPTSSSATAHKTNYTAAEDKNNKNQINQSNQISNHHNRMNSGSPLLAGGSGSQQEQTLSDFVMQLEDYNPTIPDTVTSYYLNSAGFDASDPRIVRFISIAAQKFISDVANDALQHCKTRTNNTPNSGHASKGGGGGNGGGGANGQKSINKDRKYTLTMEDLTPALADYGITVRKAHYFV